MGSDNTPPEGATLGERLEAERARLFVGRERELENLTAVLARDSPTLLAYVHGPGGIGKTELLRALQRRAEARGHAVAWVDASAAPVNPVGLRAAFDAALAATPRRPDESVPLLVLVDTLEHLTPLTEWIWTTFLPGLSSDLRVVLAGRERPPIEVGAHPAWSRLLRVIGLGALGRDESLAYLAGRGVANEHRQHIVDRTYGHPLALAVVGEMVAQNPNAVPRFDESPDLVQGLLAQLLRQVPSEAHQLALWSLSIVRHLNEDLLRAMLGALPRRADAVSSTSLYEWLQRLAFVRREPRGLTPHDLVRELLQADLSWRDPNAERRLAVAAMELLFERMQHAGPEMVLLAGEIGFIIGGRSRLVQRGGGGEYAPEPLQPKDWSVVLDMAERHEGPESGACVRHWLSHGGEAYAIRSLDDRVAGFVLFLVLDRTTVATDHPDPAVRAAGRYLSDIGAAQARTLYLRYWMAADTYKDVSPVQAAVSIFSVVAILLHRPDILLHCEAAPDALLSRVPPGIMAREAGADFVLGGHPYGTIAIDFRHESQVAWTRRYMMAILMGTPPAAPMPLERSEFDRAIRQALRSFGRADLLATNPLLGCAFVRRAGPSASSGEAAQALQQAIRDQLQMFRRSDKDAVYYDVLTATYLEPRAKQLEAADELALPYGSYRRHLATAVRRLSDALWQRESEANSG